MPGDSDKTGESPEDPAAANPGELVAREAEREIAAKIERLLPSDRPIAPHELAKVLAQVVSVEIREAYSFQGPMPPPSMLREYDAALPGLAERLVARAEAEQQFRHKTGEFQMDTVSKEQWHAAAKTYLGQILAFIIAMTAIGGGIIYWRWARARLDWHQSLRHWWHLSQYSSPERLSKLFERRQISRLLSLLPAPSPRTNQLSQPPSATPRP